jgi:hypothetical protein
MIISTIDESQRKARGLAGFGVISSARRATSAFVFIVSNFGTTVNQYSLDSPMGAFEMATSFGLFKGLRPSGIAGPDQASDRAQAGAV